VPTLLAANKRLNTAYVLKEQFAQLWEYRSEVWARKFFEHWRKALRWQRLEPFEKFAALIERHWEGIAPYCQPDNFAMKSTCASRCSRVRCHRCHVTTIREIHPHDSAKSQQTNRCCRIPENHGS